MHKFQYIIEINKNGIDILHNDSQKIKAHSSIILREGGSLIFFNDLHSLKALFPMDSIKPCGKGICDYSSDDVELLQLYCGHKICKGCLTDEITHLLSENQLPTCRSMNQKAKKICNCEIIPTDVKECIIDPHISKVKIRMCYMPRSSHVSILRYSNFSREQYWLSYR